MFSKYPDLYYKVGHYLNIIDPEYSVTGMAYSGYDTGDYGYGASSQEFYNDWNSYNANDTTFDASVYRAKVEAYVNQIKSAQSTYEDALKQVEAAKTALDKANTAHASAVLTLDKATSYLQDTQDESARTTQLLADATRKAAETRPRTSRRNPPTSRRRRVSPKPRPRSTRPTRTSSRPNRTRPPPTRVSTC